MTVTNIPDRQQESLRACWLGSVGASGGRYRPYFPSGWPLSLSPSGGLAHVS